MIPRKEAEAWLAAGSGRRAAGWLVALLLAAVVLAGCASAPTSESSFNPVTSYPAVGDRVWHL
jgi:hypothetical protein